MPAPVAAPEIVPGHFALANNADPSIIQADQQAEGEHLLDLNLQGRGSIAGCVHCEYFLACRGRVLRQVQSAIYNLKSAIALVSDVQPESTTSPPGLPDR